MSPSPDARETPATADDDRRAWQREVDAFERMRAGLCADPELIGRFVAVYGGSVVDRGEHEFDLARRVFRRYPGQVVLVKRVEPHEPIFELPSPELA